MKQTNRSGFRDHSTEYERPDCLCVVHRVVCTICTLVAAYWLLRCCLSICGALQDARKFAGLGFSYPLHHYLLKNEFPEAALMCVLVSAELLHYFFQYRRTTKLWPVKGMIWVFAGLLVLHGVIFWNANFIVDSSVSTWAQYYCDYAKFSLLPSAAYFGVYGLLLYHDR